MNGESFLDAVQTAGAAGRLHDPGGTDAHRAGLVDIEDPVASFIQSAGAAGAIVHEAARHEAARMVVDIMEGSRARSFLSWDEAHLPLDGLTPEIEARGYTRLPGEVPRAPGDRREHQLRYFDCDVGITGAEGGLADTGSLVLASGPGKPRMASLIPNIHIALIEQSGIVPSLRHMLRAEPAAPASVANWTVITGPSRTADIEMVITHGVHGPRELHIVLLPD